MAGLLTPEMKSCIGRSEPPQRVEVSRREIIKYSISTEQRNPKYLSGDEAPPMFVFGLVRNPVPIDQLGPDGLPLTSNMPDLPLKRVMAGGTQMKLHQPITPGQTLVATQTLVDMYEKAGRQGPLIFVVQSLKVETERGEPVMEEIQTRIVR